MFDKDGQNNFATSSLRTYLNGPFLKKMVKSGAEAEAFKDVTLDLTADDGLDDYGEDTVKIGLITCALYRQFRKIIPNAPDWWWTATAFSTKSNGCAYSVRFVNTSGALNSYNAYHGYYGVRPLCVLKSDILVSVE